jgi:hypothetical protein
MLRVGLAMALSVILVPAAADAQYDHSYSETTNLGRIGVMDVGTDPQLLNLHVQWGVAGYYYGRVQAPYGYFAMDWDLTHSLTLHVMGGGGLSWRKNDRDTRSPLGFGEVGVFVHGRRIEAINERLTLEYDSDSSSETYGDTTYTRTRSSETYVNAPGYRLRMRGLNVGAFAWYSLSRVGIPTGVDSVMRQYTEVLLLGGYIGYSNTWVKSNAYIVEGYGRMGGATYFRFFVDLLAVPLPIFPDVDVDTNQDEDRFGGRLGAETIWGSPTGMCMRLELGIMPGGLGGYFLVTLGVGGNIHTG